MKKKITYSTILFSILMVLFFLPMFQEHCKVFRFKSLVGESVKEKTKFPKFSINDYRSGLWQKTLESYTSENYGFREPMIRLYSQYLFDFYQKTPVDFVSFGKGKWMFYKHTVDDYYGKEMFRWQKDNETAVTAFNNEINLVNKFRNLLKQYDIEFLWIIVPDKPIIYSEYLPDDTFDTTSINGRKYFTEKFDSIKLDYIDMNPYYLQIKDTSSFLLFPPTGHHWNFSAIYGADSILRYMEQQKNIRLPQIIYSNFHKSCKFSEERDRDIENALNLVRDVNLKGIYTSQEADVTFLRDSSVSKPNALFVGNSFVWQILDYVPSREIFEDFTFLYYNREAYIGHDKKQRPISEIDYAEKVLCSDYVVWLSNAAQIYKCSYNFIEDALISLCVSQDRQKQRRKEISDSLRRDTVFCNNNKKQFEYKLKKKTDELLRNVAVAFPELLKDSVLQVVNPNLDRYLTLRKINRDIEWKTAIFCQTSHLGKSYDELLQEEITNVLLQKPLLRDNKEFVTRDNFLNIHREQIMKDMQSDPKQMKSIKEKAKKYDKTMEQAIYDDADWILDNKIKQKNIIIPEFLE
ncbi:MAG: hypothetical protein J5588_03650 [Bacteroidales bacterium]|nr:hypothetical protein [Bacteroidales bacterium]MBP5372274.1 hypothetical protein [Bacteroidales bacterium]